MIADALTFLILGFGVGLVAGMHEGECAVHDLRAQLEAIKRMLPEVGP